MIGLYLSSQSLFLISVPKKLKVIFNEDMKDKWNTTEGIYVIAPTLDANKKPHWLQENGKHAIWYDQKFTSWKLGLASNLGTSNKAILLTDRRNKGTALPYDTPWKYLTSKKPEIWTESDGIHVTVVDGEILFNVAHSSNEPLQGK